jgi:hypothetical protein
MSHGKKQCPMGRVFKYSHHFNDIAQIRRLRALRYFVLDWYLAAVSDPGRYWTSRGHGISDGGFQVQWAQRILGLVGR